MTFFQSIAGETTVGVGVADEPEGLFVIRQPDCAAAIWQRSPIPSFQSWLDGLAPDQLPRARMILRPDAVHAALTETCDLAGTPAGPERDRLIDDTAALAAMFAKLTRAPYLRLRYDVVTTNACRKFHVDAVVARLVCTYRGTGTQYGISTDGAEPSRI
ncbi:MAG: DUF1826 domain-containing protein, partial [Pseudomonadota bacterium]